ncbi:MAG TPA: PilZ domain-containing protein [Thermodesulfovibrionales bacterium]|nr:PilZ domain-containing protein [Thermodesulfovibrionales bacterium]
MEEKRTHRRFNVSALGVNGTVMLANHVEVRDLSIGGISLKADRKMNISNEYMLSLGDRDRITAKGAVMWCTLSELKGPGPQFIPIYSAGLRFTDIVKERIIEFVRSIENHLEESYGGETGKRYEVRLRGYEHKRAVLTAQGACRLKALSPGGMVVETDHSLQIGERFLIEIISWQGDHVSLTGRIASCVVAKNQCDVGVKFIEMRDEARRKLDRIRDVMNRHKRISSPLSPLRVINEAI